MSPNTDPRDTSMSTTEHCDVIFGMTSPHHVSTPLPAAGWEALQHPPMGEGGVSQACPPVFWSLSLGPRSLTQTE